MFYRFNQVGRFIACVLCIPIAYILFLGFGGKYTCLLRVWTGWSCAGCGGTHMVYALLDGNLHQAFRYNPFLFVTGPPIALATIWQLCEFVKSGIIHRTYTRVVVSWVVLANVFAVARNIGSMRWMLPTIL